MGLTKEITAWKKVSEHRHVHVSGARIERRGYPDTAGWYLVPADPSQPASRFKPTPEGCDQAFIAFNGRRAAFEVLSRLIESD